MFKYLNSKSKYDLVDLGTNHITIVIMEVGKVHIKRNFIQATQAKCNTINKNGRACWVL